MISINLCDIAILNIKSTDYHYIISGISKTLGHTLNTNYQFDQKGRAL